MRDRTTSIRVFDFYSEVPSMHNFVMTDETRKYAEENMNLLHYTISKMKRDFPYIDSTNFDDHIDLFYLVFCRVCHKHYYDNKGFKLSTWLSVEFRSLCKAALRHYNTKYMEQWREYDKISLDKPIDFAGDEHSEHITDTRVDITGNIECNELHQQVLEYVAAKAESGKPTTKYKCSVWEIMRLYLTVDRPNYSDFRDYLDSIGVLADDVTSTDVYKSLLYCRNCLKGVFDFDK